MDTILAIFYFKNVIGTCIDSARLQLSLILAGDRYIYLWIRYRNTASAWVTCVKNTRIRLWCLVSIIYKLLLYRCKCMNWYLSFMDYDLLASVSRVLALYFRLLDVKQYVEYNPRKQIFTSQHRPFQVAFTTTCISGPLFTKRNDVFQRYLVKSRTLEIRV